MAKLEYIWLDGYKPTQSLRSKTKIEGDFSGKLEDCPNWSFDGSSTEQAPGGSSDCVLKPVYICVDPQRKDGYLVMCEVLDSTGKPHESNGRALIEDDDNDFWFGFEQEYFLWDTETDKPLGFPINGYQLISHLVSLSMVTLHLRAHTTVQLVLKMLTAGILLKNTWMLV